MPAMCDLNAPSVAPEPLSPDQLTVYVADEADAPVVRQELVGGAPVEVGIDAVLIVGVRVLEV